MINLVKELEFSSLENPHLKNSLHCLLHLALRTFYIMFYRCLDIFIIMLFSLCFISYILLSKSVRGRTLDPNSDPNGSSLIPLKHPGVFGLVSE